MKTIIDNLQLLGCHYHDLVVIKLSLIVSYTAAFECKNWSADCIAVILTRMKRHLGFEWTRVINGYRVALIVLSMSLAALHGASQAYHYYLAAPAIAWHQRLLIERAVWEQKAHDNPRLPHACVQKILANCDDSLRMSAKWMKEDANYQTCFFWLIQGTTKLLKWCIIALFFRD